MSARAGTVRSSFFCPLMDLSRQNNAARRRLCIACTEGIYALLILFAASLTWNELSTSSKRFGIRVQGEGSSLVNRMKERKVNQVHLEGFD